MYAGNVHSAKRILQLMKTAGIAPSAEAYTSLIHSCVKDGAQDSIEYAFQVINKYEKTLSCTVHEYHSVISRATITA